MARAFHIWVRMIIAGWCLSTICIVNAVAQELPSTLDFIKPHQYGNMSLSPDGKLAAFAETDTKNYCLDRFKTGIAKSQNCADKHKEYRSTYQIIVYDLINNKVQSRLDVPTNGHLSCLKWVQNSRILACISSARTSGSIRLRSLTTVETGFYMFSIGADADIDPPVMITRLGQMDTDGLYGIPWIVSPMDAETDEIIFRTGGRGYESLAAINIFSDNWEFLTKGEEPTIHWVTNSKGEYVVRVECKNRKKCKTYQIRYRPDINSKWTLVRELRESEDGYIDELFFPFGIDEASGHIQVVSRVGSDPRSSVKLFDPATKTFTKTIFQHPKHDIERLLFDPSTKAFVGATVYGDTTEYMIDDPELAAHYSLLRAQFGPTDSISIVENNVRGELAVVYVKSPETPGQYFLYDPALKKLSPMMARNKSLDQSVNSASQSIEVTMRDGSKIDAYHYYPTDKPKGAPLIVMPHGGPHVRDYFAYDGWVQFLVSRGYQVIQMNFRGSTGYGVAHERAGFGEWGGLMQNDVTDTVKYMHNNGYALPENTCLFGYSYGGYVALYGGGKTPDLYACIVSGAGVSDLVRSMKDDNRLLDDQAYSYMQQSMGDLKDRDRLEERSPANFAENFKAPVLLIHGEKDVRVPRYHSIRMRARLEDANKDVTYVELKDSAHNGWTLNNEVLFLETVEAFLAKHIGP